MTDAEQIEQIRRGWKSPYPPGPNNSGAQDVAALLAIVDRVTAERDNLRAVVEAVTKVVRDAPRMPMVPGDEPTAAEVLLRWIEIALATKPRPEVDHPAS